MMRGGQVRNGGNYKNPCLTMHQPWASLLVYGIKRIEGRSWPAPVRGRLWIHAASKVPEEATIKALEEFYREIYAVNGITNIKFPEHYPVSRLLGCVEVVGCVRCEELQNWEALPEGVRLEGQTDFCWLCEQPQKLIVPFEMRGYQGVYNLEKKVYDAAVRGLTQVHSLFPVKFELPNPKDPFSLKPGSISSLTLDKKVSGIKQSSSLTAAIAGARAAATQFSRKGPNLQTHSTQDNTHVYVTRSKSKSIEENAQSVGDSDEVSSSSISSSSSNRLDGGPMEDDRTLTINYDGDSNKRTVVLRRGEQSGDGQFEGIRRHDRPPPSLSEQQQLPGAPKSVTEIEKIRSLRDIPLLEQVFDHRKYPTGDEGWNPALSEYPPGFTDTSSNGQSHDRVEINLDEVTSPRKVGVTATSNEKEKEPVADQCSAASNKRKKRSRTQSTTASSMRESLQSSMQELAEACRNIHQGKKETFEERMKRKDPYAIPIAMDILRSLPGVTQASKFYWEAVMWLRDVDNRLVFMSQITDEMKLQCLEYALKLSRDSIPLES